MKVLIIEDNYMHLEMASELLSKSDVNVLKADNAICGIELAKRQRPDLILMDMDLPGMNGYEATMALKNNLSTSDIPVVALTALVMKDEIQKAFNSGCTGFISKPIDVSVFADTVKNYHNRQASTQSVDEIYNKISDKVCSMQSEVMYSERNDRHGAKHRVLVTDDNPINAELLKEAVEQIGESVVIAYSGQATLEIIQNEKIDLILLDIMMPEMSGFEVLEVLQGNPKTSDIPVIFISALNETKDIVKGLGLGSYGYITKPYNIDELKARVSNVLRIKDLQDELKCEKEKFDRINKFSADGIILLNSDFEITSCSDSFMRWLGIAKECIIGQEFCSVINCFEQDSTFNFNEVPDSKTNIIQEVLIKTGDSSKFIEINCSKIHNSKDETDGYILVLRDVSAQKEIEKQKETFIATLTHDLKTPIRAETRSLELLLKGSFGQLSESQYEIVNETLSSNKFMAGMIDTLLAGYKYDNGKVDLHKDILNINEIITACSTELKYLIAEKKQTVELDFQENEQLTYADPIEIKRLVMNLFSNAITYTQEYGTIKISTSLCDNKVRVDFKDNGRGISKEQMPYLFDKYTSYSKKFRQVGTGLGLYVAKQIVEAHNGSIEVASEEGHGAQFTFTIPIIPAVV